MSFIETLKNKVELEPAFYVTQNIELPIYSFDISNLIDSNDITDKCLSLKTDDLGNQKIVKNGWQSPYYLQGSKGFNLFKDLINVIEDKANAIVDFRKKLYVSEIWFVLYGIGTNHTIHNHTAPNDKFKYIFSGAYYPAASKLSAPIIFRDKKDNSKETKIPIRQNKLLLFSSNLYHYVPECTDEDSRIAISFNLEKGQ